MWHWSFLLSVCQGIMIRKDVRFCITTDQAVSDYLAFVTFNIMDSPPIDFDKRQECMI